MRSSKIIHVVSCHAAGEVGDVIVAGVPIPPGDTIWEQSRFIHRDGTLRNFVLHEPRGGVFRHVNLLVPPKDPRAQMGWIVMEPADTPPMSGSNCICVATVLFETGIVPMHEPVSRLVLESPGGLIEVSATCNNGKVEKVSVRNVPAFATTVDFNLEVGGFGTLLADVAYGGDSFVLIDGRALGLAIKPDEARDIAEIGMRLTEAANEQISFAHPERDWQHISFCQLTAPISMRDGVMSGLSAVAIRPGKVDRSPCGTGCSARMAVLHAKGKLRTGGRFIGLSILGTQFDCLVEDEVSVGQHRGIVPIISGTAWITGTHQHMLEPTDPFPGGYKLSDTWPMRRTDLRD